MAGNGSNNTLEYRRNQDPFSLLSTKVIFCVLFSLVTITCLVGNSLVLYVLVYFRKMHSITNFFLANLAVADLCVGLFCIMQTLITPHLLTYWPFGKVMCTMLYFVQCASYTASILILTAISVERYMVILHPLASRTMVNRRWRIRLIGLMVWILAAAYASPMILNSYMVTIHVPQYTTVGNITIITNITIHYCMDRALLDIKSFVMVNFVLMYVVPLSIMIFIYTKICRKLWNSGTLRVESNKNAKMNRGPRRSQSGTCLQDSEHDVTLHEDMDEFETPPEQVGLCTIPPNESDAHDGNTDRNIEHDTNLTTDSHCLSHSETVTLTKIQGRKDNNLSSVCRNKNMNASRRKVIRLLIVVICSFAVCVLPHHIRQIAHNWAPNPIPSFNDMLMVPATYLLLYLNSCLNPILYALLSEKFRNAYRDMGCSNCRNN